MGCIVETKIINGKNGFNIFKGIYRNHPVRWAIGTIIAILAIITPIAYENTFRPLPSPTARITATAKEGPVPLAVSFYSVNSTDPKGNQLTYQWFIDGKLVSAATEFSNTFKKTGDYMVKLIVTNERNITGQQGIVIKALAAKPLEVEKKQAVKVNDEVPLKTIRPVLKQYQLTHGDSADIKNWGIISCHFEVVDGDKYAVLSSKNEKKILYNPDILAFNDAGDTLYLRVTKIDENRQIVYFLIE